MKVINFFITTAVFCCGFSGVNAISKQYGKRRAMRMLEEMKRTNDIPNKKEFL